MSLPPVIDLGEEAPIVIDNGSGWMKAGYSCDDRPRCILPTMVGRPKNRVVAEEEAGQKKRADKAEKECYIGKEAQLKRGALILNHPIEKGVITNWDDMPESHPLLLTEAARNPPKEREKMTEIMFETFRVPQLYSQAKEVLALYTSGKTTGVVVDCGEATTSTVPVYEGYKISSSILTLDIAGRTLTDSLAKMLADKDTKYCAAQSIPHHPGALQFPPFPMFTDREAIRMAKEKYCFVALDFEQEVTTVSSGRDSEISFPLPDGHLLYVGSERFRCPEGLFQPQYLGVDVNGIHEMCYNSIMRCDTDIRRDLYGNVVLSGGTTMFAGMSDRMSKELMALAPTAMKITIIAPAERKNASWLGGSIFAALGLEKVWITRDEFDEHGPSIIHKKCF